jgi:hypothetical protein
MINDPDNTQDGGLTTEQIAAARPGQAQPGNFAPAGYDSYGDDATRVDSYDDEAAPVDSYDDDAAAPVDTGLTAAEHAGRGPQDAADGGSMATDPGQHANLLDESELQSLTLRWKDIQAEFVDEPTTAVQEADALVAELMQRLAAMFATERHELENRWAGGNEVSTEDLRQGLRLYRSFFERLLAA